MLTHFKVNKKYKTLLQFIQIPKRFKKNEKYEYVNNLEQ